MVAGIWPRRLTVQVAGLSSLRSWVRFPPGLFLRQKGGDGIWMMAIIMILENSGSVTVMVIRPDCKSGTCVVNAAGSSPVRPIKICVLSLTGKTTVSKTVR